MDIKNEVLYRVYALLIVVIAIAGVLFGRTLVIGVLNGEKWKAKGEEVFLKYKEIEAERGNIIAADGSVLATSIPYYDLYFDPLAASDEDFNENLDTLAYCLATFVDQSYTVGGYRQQLMEWRADTSNRYRPIAKKVSYSVKQQIEQFPLFNLGQFRGGLIDERASDRRLPFGLLAQRTIGYIREGANPVGLEGYFNDILEGDPGGQFMVCVDKRRDLWVPVDDLMEIDPESGDDIKTTLDINLQDIVEQALLDAVKYHQADWGAAVLMEVKTGQIKAIANLDKVRNGYWEAYNRTVGTAVEPGSTFKAASMLALLEDEYINLNDTVFINRGEWEYYDERMVDSSPESFLSDSVTIRKAFEISSNVGISKMVTQHYGSRTKENKEEGAERFIKRLKQFNLHIPTGIEIKGEDNPYIKEAYSEEDNWSGTTLPWMSIGYELELTPLQLLTFYNAIANNGTMMKPYLVTEVQRFGEVKKTFKPTVIKKQIAKKASIAAVQELLRGVVEEGTAKKLKSDEYSFAGKTGTAQINYKRFDGGTQVGGYQASFVGYFPADNPVYSCIVVVNNPRLHGNYGSEVAGPVFKRIADECFGAEIQLHEELPYAVASQLRGRLLPDYDVGYEEDLDKLLNYFEMPHYGNPESEIAVLRNNQDSLLLQEKTLSDKVVPAVTGMGLKDALYVLENRGLRVKIEGFGKVARQSLIPGTAIRGQEITLYLR
jgi:cell division protein FtsI (penicillin-binding protein 3)